MFSASKSGQYQGYQISRSVRLRASANGFFSRSLVAGTNPADTSNFRKTFSFWVKRGVLSSAQHIFSNSISSTNRWQINFPVGDTINVFAVEGGTTVLNLTTSAVFRDPSAWYHITIASDTTLATAADRIKIYVNGVLQTVTGTNATLNSSTAAFFFTPGTGTWFARIGNEAANGTGVAQLDAYLTEINVIDGQTLTPSSFGIFNAYGVWSPTKYNGTYGTNGFYLNFSDPSAATAAAIGADRSGNGNNWTPNNISVTAGATYDSMLDVPTPWGDGGNGRGNYCTLNPLKNNASLTSGNLDIAGPTTGGNYSAFCTHATNSTPIYYEATIKNYNSGSIGFAGFAKPQVAIVTTLPGTTGSFGFRPSNSTWTSYLNGTSTSLTGLSGAVTNDVLMVAFNPSTGKAWIGKNGTWYNSGNPAADTNPTLSGIDTGIDWNPALNIYRDASNFIEFSVNFGQRPFSYTPPTGFNALNTFNLPEPSIDNGGLYMAATTYTGTGASLSVNNTVNNASFQPDFVWVKGRSGATDHALYDAVRGVQLQLESNTTTAETTETTGLTAFNSNGFTVGALAQMNTNTATYVGWQWNAGGSTVTNTSGSISAQVRASTTAGFSVVTYTGTGASSATVGHGLGVAPRFFIIKQRNGSTYNWLAYHASLGAGSYLSLSATSGSAADTTMWSNTAPTSSVITLSSGANIVITNPNTGTMLIYAFAPVTGFSAFGSYTGNGSADGPFVFCGFRPRFVMVKRTDGVSNWSIRDTSRNAANTATAGLFADTSAAESTQAAIDILSNGFKCRDAGGAATNASAGTYIFAAFAENPFKYSLAR
jgi:hypothetical protein